jgi:single-strand DNA-binding protein
MSEKYKAKGRVIKVDDTMEFDSGFTKREFVIETDDEKYPQEVKFEVVKDKWSLLDKFPEGTEVEVMFNLRGNEYNGKHYVSLQAWKIEGTGRATVPDDDEEDESQEIPFWCKLSCCIAPPDPR